MVFFAAALATVALPATSEIAAIATRICTNFLECSFIFSHLSLKNSYLLTGESFHRNIFNRAFP